MKDTSVNSLSDAFLAQKWNPVVLQIFLVTYQNTDSLTPVC